MEASIPVSRGLRGQSWPRSLLFLGPAIFVSVGYMDPGNWATDLEGGARFGYQLLWLLAGANILAMVLQQLCARLGVITGLDLAQACRQSYPRPAALCLWVLCEFAIIACDLAEVIGSAVALNLVFNIPLAWGAVITVFDVFLLLTLQRYGLSKLEALVGVLVLTIGACLVLELWLVKPVWTDVAAGFVPRLDSASLYIAVGILGAIVMPHNLYLHSALVKTRKVGNSELERRAALRTSFANMFVALNIAFLINASILIIAAGLFYSRGLDITDLREAHQMLAPLLGSMLAPTLFAVALLCAGQSASVTGTMAGQVVMEGFLNLRINPFARRLLTRSIAVIPAVATLVLAGEQSAIALLVGTQVVLSLQLPFAIVPLLRFTNNRRLMGSFASGAGLRIAASAGAAVVIVANVWLVMNVALRLEGALLVAALAGIALFIAFLVFIAVVPLRGRDEPALLQTGKAKLLEAN